VRVYKGIQRIDFETKILNNDKLVRYRLLFPTSIQSGRRFDEIPFAAIERPAQHEYPAQNWIDWSDGNHGVALLNVGLPGSNVSDGTLMLSLMRSARVDANADINGPPTTPMSFKPVWNSTGRCWCAPSISIPENSGRPGACCKFHRPTWC
jgi:alpha-mannosidase